MTFRSACGLAVLAVAVVGCEASMYATSTTPYPGYGNAVRQNSSVMIIDPAPATAANTELDFDGRKDSLAIERYREGKVIQPIELRPTESL